MHNTRHRIVLVEDNPADADLAMEWLESAPQSFDVIQVSTLSEAESALADSPPDLVLLDLNLPDSWGVDTMRRIKRLAGDIPVVVLSGIADDELVKSVMAEGADEVLGKNDAHRQAIALSTLRAIDRANARVHQRQLEKILEAAPDGFVIVDRDGIIRYANKAASRLFGRRRADFVSCPFGFRVGGSEPSEIKVGRSDGERTCEMRVARIEWNREPAYLASLRDVTESKELEKQLMLSDRMASIGLLAAGVAHEINNPLAAIIGNLDLAKREIVAAGETTPLPPRLSDRIGDARKAADSVRIIVRDLRLFSRADEDKCVPVDLVPVIDTTLRMARGEIRYRARVAVDHGDPVTVLANESRLGQVFLNLLVNAAQSIPEGDVESNEIRITTRDQGDGRATVTIADTGCGIPEDVQKSLFTPFFTTKPAGVGTGLGLAICHRIITSMGGDITFESAPGAGTKFHVTLPISTETASAADADAAADPLAAALSERPAGAPKPRILVIDDERAIAGLAANILSPAYQVTTLERADEALEILAEGVGFDLILCDLMMPGTSGMDFYERARTLGDDLQRKIVFVTGGAFTPAARAFLASVPNAAVEKPFDARSLLEAVTAALR